MGDRLKQRTAELEAVRLKLSEPVEPDVDRDEFAARLAAIPILNGDARQAREVLRKLGVEQVKVEPTPDGGWSWTGRADFRGVLSNGGSASAKPSMNFL